MMIGNLVVHPPNAISAVVPQIMNAGRKPEAARQNFAEVFQDSKMQATAASKPVATEQSQDSTVSKSAGSDGQAVFTDEADRSVHRHGELIDLIPRDASERLLRESNGREQGNGFVDSAANGWNEVETAIGSAGNLSALQLLELQVRVYRVAHKIEIFSKVADQTSSGIKSVLNTNI